MKPLSRFKALLIAETEKAFHFRVVDRKVWVPRSLIKSCVKGPPDKKGHRECVVDVEEWFAEKNGL